MARILRRQPIAPKNGQDATRRILLGSTSHVIPVSGGITFAGTAEQVHTRIFSATGGATFGGTGSMVFTPSGGTSHTIPVSGGIAFSGSGLITKSHEVPVSGGITFGGTSPFTKSHGETVSGGVAFGGTGSMIFNGGGGVAVANERTKVGVGT